MNKLNKILVLATFATASVASNSFADSSNFAGPYIGVTGQAVGTAIDGKHTEEGAVTKGTAGAIGITAGIEVGYNVPISDTAFITIAASYNPLDADFKADDAANADDVNVTLEDIQEIGIEPSFTVTDSSAVFIKAAYSEFSLSASGSGLQNTQSFDLTGETFAVGTKTVTDTGVYIKTEVGMTSYDAFTLKEVGTDEGDGVRGTVNADVEAAYGKILVGFKF